MRSILLILCAGFVANLGNAAEPLGKVTPDLRRQVGEAMGPQLFRDLDTDGDGQLNENEAAFDLELRREFARADADTDNAISLDEYLDFHSEQLKN